MPSPDLSSLLQPDDGPHSADVDDDDDNGRHDAHVLADDPLAPPQYTNFAQLTRCASLADHMYRSSPARTPASAFSTYSFLDSPGNPPNTSRRRRRTLYQDGEPIQLASSSNGNADATSHLNTDKDHNTTDWHTDGPGRRVGYDDLTAIDWVFEYAKERQRLRVLHSNATGVLGYLHLFFDASQIWAVLILTGLATGLIAACINIASDWLGDMKTGICTPGEGGGRFYLNRVFCCWGLDELAQCHDWHPWSEALHISSRGGAYVISFLFFVLFSVFFAAVASIFVTSFAAEAKQSGIPEIKTMLGGFVMRRFLGGWTLLVKSLGLCLSVASGMWLGKEGPLVHVACCCANLFTQLFPILNKNEARKREILSAAAAAGISVAFGAPVGGVLFSLEQLSYYFPDKTMWQSFVCAMIAAVSLQAANPFRTGKLVLYQVTYTTGWHAFELVPFAILGALGGLYGALFIKVNMRIASWRRRYQFFKSPVLEVVLVAAITAVVNYPNRFMRAQFPELVAVLFSECKDLADEQLGLCGKAPAPLILASLLAASFLGFLLSSLTFGLAIPAGIILPSMAIGALYGRAMGVTMRGWQLAHPGFFIFGSCEPDVPCVTAGTYAIVGAASALAGATRMTVSIVVIVFELTGALTYVLPIMITVMIGKWVGDAFGTRSIYESWILFNGLPYLENREDSVGLSAVAAESPVAGLMTPRDELVILPASGLSVASLSQLLEQHPFRGFPVVLDPANNMLIGYISRLELTYALAAAKSRGLPESTPAFFVHQARADPASILDLRPWMDQTPMTLSAKTSLHLTSSIFLRLGLRYVLFADRGQLQGMLTKKDVWLVLHGSSDDHWDVMEERQGQVDDSAGQGEDEGSGLLARDDAEDTDRTRVG